jgi:protein-S-isoprenylcysteine O-methyltransferase Ste14
MTVQRTKIPKKQLVPYLAIFMVVPIITYLVGRWIDRLFSVSSFPPFPINLVAGLSVFTIGLFIGISATKVLYKEGHGLPWGGVRIKARSSRLVVTGPYAYTRNPMILGYSLLPCGMGLMFRSPGMFTVVPLMVALINILIVKFLEEPSLEHRFGQKFLDYKASTPFLIPRPSGFFGLILESYFRRSENTE